MVILAQGQPQSCASSLAPILAAGIAFVAAVVAPIIHKIYDREKERKSLVAALSSEINGIYNLLVNGGYKDGLATVIADMEANPKVIYNVKFRVRRNYFGVYENNLSKIGCLDSNLSKQIPAFYLMLFSVLEDVDSLYEKEHDKDTRDEILRFYKSIKQKFDQLDLLARPLIDSLKNY